MRRPPQRVPFGGVIIVCWLGAVVVLAAGTVSGFVGAAIAQRSVALPPERPTAPQSAPSRVTVLPEFRSGVEAADFVADESPAVVPAEPAVSPPPPPPPQAARSLEPEADTEVEPPPEAPVPAPSPGTYVITRGLVDAVANNPESVGAESTHIAVVEAEDGTPVGLRITGVGRDSGLRTAGIRNGDVLVAVNGEVVDSPQRGVAMYQRLSTASSVSVELIRRGEPRRIRIVVTD